MYVDSVSMGIFYDHGVQYMVVTKTGKHVIVSIKDADQRLLQSEYYKTREDSWFSGNGSFCKPVAGVDISLTDVEKERLESVLTTADEVESYGWYDVQTISDTYGI